MATIFLTLKIMMIPQSKNVCQLVWHLYVNTAVEGSDLYCYNSEGDRNSILSPVPCRMDVTTKTACLHQNNRLQVMNPRELSLKPAALMLKISNSFKSPQIPWL
jgi:hypothetical protein